MVAIYTIYWKLNLDISKYKTDTKKAKRLIATTFAIAKLEEWWLYGEQ